jgi:exopolysaccharide production protein ExoQ
MLCGSRSLADWLNGPHVTSTIVTGTESNPLNVEVGVLVFSFALYSIIKNRVSLTGVLRQNAPIVVLFAYCLVSCIWSDDTGVSFRRWVLMMIDFSIVVAILGEPNKISAIKTFFTRFAIFALPLSIVFIKYFPDMGTHWDSTGEGVMWTGVCLHKNSLGTGLAACMLFYVWKWLILKDYRTKKADILLFAIALFLMFNPEVKGSSTAQLSLFASLGVLLCIRLFQRRIRMFAVVFYVIIGSYFAVNTVTSIFFKTTILKYITLASKRDMTFTGRTFIWDAVLDEAAKSPIVGTGYGMFWTGQRLVRLSSHKGVENIYQSHNGYIETYANLGIVGLVLLIVALFTSLNRRLKGIGSDYQFNSLAVAFIVQCLLAEFFEATVLSGPSSRWMYLLLVILDVPRNASLSQGNGYGESVKTI